MSRIGNFCCGVYAASASLYKKRASSRHVLDACMHEYVHAYTHTHAHTVAEQHCPTPQQLDAWYTKLLTVAQDEGIISGFDSNAHKVPRVPKRMLTSVSVVC